MPVRRRHVRRIQLLVPLLGVERHPGRSRLLLPCEHQAVYYGVEDVDATGAEIPRQALRQDPLCGLAWGEPGREGLAAEAGGGAGDAWAFKLS